MITIVVLAATALLVLLVAIAFAIRARSVAHEGQRRDQIRLNRWVAKREQKLHQRALKLRKQQAKRRLKRIQMLRRKKARQEALN
jgi:hypothetical protein